MSSTGSSGSFCTNLPIWTCLCIAFSLHNSTTPSRVSEHLMMFNDKNGFRQDCALASLQKHFLIYSETNSQRICMHYHTDLGIFNLQRFCDESQIITLLAFHCSLPLTESACTQHIVTWVLLPSGSAWTAT